jgi:hypothetical protein
MGRGVGQWLLFRCLGWCSLALDQRPVSSLRSGAALSPRRATYFSLSRQRNLRKRKATLLSASLRCATGNLRCSVQPGSRSNSPAAQTIAGPDPSGPPLLGADRRGGAWIQIRGALSPLRALNDATFLIASCARIHRAIGLNARETARSNSRCINAIPIQIKRQTSPGFTNFFTCTNVPYIQCQPNKHEALEGI